MLTTTGSKTMGFSEVSTLLWREREALQLLLFKLVEEQLIVSAGHTRWLAAANDEIEAALDQLRGTEVLRASEVDVIAAGARAVRQTLLSVTDTVQTYDSHGSAAATPNGPMLMDEQA